MAVTTQAKKRLVSNQIIEFVKKKDYKFVKELGQGAFGQTVLLHDSTIGEDFVAKKYAPLNNSYKEEFYNNFVEEIKFLYKVYHPNIVRIFNYYLYPKEFTGFILMEYINGIDIGEYVKKHPENINQIFLQTLEGFSYLESNNILHRDIRTQNIMIGNNASVKIIDFGFGKRAHKTKDFDKSISLNWPFSLPDEFEKQTYNFKTEVYFVGKLFEKLIHENQIEHFEYKTILHDMCKPSPIERKESFASILTEVSSNKFITMDFSDSERECYRDFSWNLSNLVTKMGLGTKYTDNIDKILLELESLYQSVMLEEYLTNTTALSNCFIDGAYKYSTRAKISVDCIEDFIKLLKGSSREKKNIILSNLHSRLDAIGRYDDFLGADIPF